MSHFRRTAERVEREDQEDKTGRERAHMHRALSMGKGLNTFALSHVIVSTVTSSCKEY